jgi:hypothetical protein
LATSLPASTIGKRIVILQCRKVVGVDATSYGQCRALYFGWRVPVVDEKLQEWNYERSKREFAHVLRRRSSLLFHRKGRMRYGDTIKNGE